VVAVTSQVNKKFCCGCQVRLDMLNEHLQYGVMPPSVSALSCGGGAVVDDMFFCLHIIALGAGIRVGVVPPC